MMDLLATVPYYTAYLSRALQLEGVKVSIGTIPYYLDAKCFQSRGLKPMPGLLRFAAWPKLSRSLRRNVKMLEAVVNLLTLAVRFAAKPPDVVHVQYLPLMMRRLPLEPLFLRWCQQRGSKIVFTVHDILPHDTGNLHRDAFQKLYDEVDMLICHSDGVRTRLRSEFGIAEEKIAVIPHGPFFYDLPAPAQEPHAEMDPMVTVLWQGILLPYKGVDTLLDAWKIVEAAESNVQLIVAGTGADTLLAEVRASAKQLGLQRVTLDLRFVSADELVSLYSRASIVVYPYRAITTSGALATGLALGKAIIASDLPAFREALQDGEDGLLVPVGDAEELAKAILELARQPAKRAEFEGRLKSRNFGDEAWLDIARKTKGVYCNMLV